MRPFIYLMLLLSTGIAAQEDVVNKANESFVDLVMQWRNSEKVKKYVAESPELEVKINSIILNGLKENKEADTDEISSFPDLFMDGLIDLNYELALDFLSDTHIGAIEGAYEKIKNHPKNDEVANLILGHMNRYKEKLITEIEKMPSRKN